jgi:hypothetical protein
MREAIALFVFAIVASSQSQPPSPTPRERAQTQQNVAATQNRQPNPDDHSTDRLVSAINQVSSAIRDWKEQENNTKQSNGSAIADSVTLGVTQNRPVGVTSKAAS